jgi:hypothetical protein
VDRAQPAPLQQARGIGHGIRAVTAAARAVRARIDPSLPCPGRMLHCRVICRARPDILRRLLTLRATCSSMGEWDDEHP